MAVVRARSERDDSRLENIIALTSSKKRGVNNRDVFWEYFVSLRWIYTPLGRDGIFFFFSINAAAKSLSAC